MILINLLPPELRKKRASAGPKLSPMLLGAAAGLILSLAAVGTFFWIKAKVPEAENRLSDVESELAVKQAQAADIQRMEAEITQFRELSETLTGMLLRKVYWARTLDEMATHMNGPWNMDGFQVRVLGLQVDPSGGGGRKDDTVSYKVRGRLKIVGDNPELAAEYIKSFFITTEQSEFWKRNRFQGKPEDGFRGYSRQILADLRKVTIELPMDWDRIQVISTKPGKR